MRILITTILLLTSLVATYSTNALAFVSPAAEQSGQNNTANNDFSFVRYREDFHVNANATNVKVESYDILLKTKSAVEQFSQLYLSYSEKMETLEVVAAYTLDADGQRHDVSSEHIYTQESYSSASAPLYVDRKVRVIVFPNLVPGSHVIYETRRTQNVPYFPGYFSMWETFSVFDQFEDAEVNLYAPANLPMNIFIRDVEGGDKPQIRNGQSHWRWRYSRRSPMKAQNFVASSWTFSPTIMVSTYGEWSQLARAYQLKASVAARVTPDIQALADNITMGINDRREYAEAIYRWVAQNIRYVAVYLGNGGLEPNSAQSILENLYGDCKDHVVILEALLAAKGIESSPALIGLDKGPILPKVPQLDHFDHVITYVPEFNLYLDSTNPWARFGQLSEDEMGTPVLLTRDAKLAYTPEKDESSPGNTVRADFVFNNTGDMFGKTERQLSGAEEIDLRGLFSGINKQNQAQVEAQMMSNSGVDGTGQLVMNSDPLDLKKAFGYSFLFKADDYVDFSVVGGMALPNPPGAESFRMLYTTTPVPDNETPFYCPALYYNETYSLQFPDSVPIISIPKDQQFHNAAGYYRIKWQRDGQKVTVNHRLQLNAVRGEKVLCQPQDYPAFRELFQQVRFGFRGQVVYGKLVNGG